MSRLLPNGELASEESKKLPLPWFRLAFRPFFLLGALFSIVSVLLWAGAYNGHFQFQPYGGSYWWHIHEMLFGFVAAIIVGFLLTAVQTWTKIPSIKGKPLMALVVLWLSARLCLLFPQSIPYYISVSLDVFFLPVAACCLAYPIIQVHLWRNLIFIPILLAMTLVNIAMHTAVSVESAHYLATTSQVMVMLVSLVMCIMGGRVFPMFTANGTQTQRVPPILWLEKISIFSVLILVILSLNFVALPAWLEGAIFIVAGLANWIRALRWRIWVTLKTPLVWSLHLSYWALSLGLIMMGLAKIQIWFTETLAIHTITVGGMGMMILSMISRVSLGHTGRKILVGPVMTIAFVIMALALIIRVFATLVFDHYPNIILVTAILWAIAYGLFVLRYTPILTRPRADGAAG